MRLSPSVCARYSMTAMLPAKHAFNHRQARLRPAPLLLRAMAAPEPPPGPPPPEKRPKPLWPRTEERVIAWWNDSMERNRADTGPRRLLGWVQLATSPLVMTVLGPLEALLMAFRR